MWYNLFNNSFGCAVIAFRLNDFDPDFLMESDEAFDGFMSHAVSVEKEVNGCAEYCTEHENPTTSLLFL